MSEKLKVQVQDENGNIFYIHTSADIVFCEDGTSVETRLGQKIDSANIVQNATTAAADKIPSAAVAKNLQDQISGLNTKSQWRAQNTTGTNVITIPSEADEAVVFVFEESRSVSYTFFLPKPILNGQNITISQGYGWSDAENKNVCQILVGFNKVHVAAIYNAGNNFVDTCVMDVYWR